MFDGGEQFHQFIASSRTSLPIPLSFPLHGIGNPSPAAFDPYAPPPPQPWSNDELLALLKLRSSMEIWFPDFTWEHVSRKLGELGFKRSGEQCKEKFDEESRHFTSSKNYRILSELDEFYNADDDREQGQVDREKVVGENEKNPSREIVEEAAVTTTTAAAKTSRKKRRRDKFEMFKGLCEAVVNKMMSKQEEMHNKLIEDIVKMDEEKIAREEMWKSQEADRIQREIEIRSREQKSAAERQATIIDFLKQFMKSSTDTTDTDHHHQIKANSNVSNSSTSNNNAETETPSSMIYEAAAARAAPAGKRWPRDEVLALIKLRCRMSGEGAEGAKVGPLWERISAGMAEVGYKRNAKRCKEKWENINKYFRKTKDSSKKRSVNSRTCPYFHHLSCLYSDGTIAVPENNPH